MLIMIFERYRTFSLRLELLILNKIESHYCWILIILTIQTSIFFYTDIIQVYTIFLDRFQY